MSDTSFDICDQINSLIGDLTKMQREMTAESDIALDKAAAVIAAEQRRIFAQANFLRNKKNHVYKFADSSLIRVTKKKLGRAKIKAYIGFDTPTLKAYPELILVEFGRPGKSARHSKDTEKVEVKRKVKGKFFKQKTHFTRKKGKFPEAATVMPIRAGFNLAKESALAAYAEDMFNRARELFTGGN